MARGSLEQLWIDVCMGFGILEDGAERSLESFCGLIWLRIAPDES